MSAASSPVSPGAQKVRARPEHEAAEELAALAAHDQAEKPPGWELSPGAVVAFVLGGVAGERSIAPKYYGSRRLIETAVATLATDRALLLVGPPGVAKSRVAEHLAAAISGDSGLVVQGAAGLEENQLRYGWNYAELLARGPSRGALTPTPLLRALEEGRIARIEELTRIAPEVQDALISVLSDKSMSIPELSEIVDARPGFNLIATANLGDRGAHRPSSALRRRFNVVALPAPATLDQEVDIVAARLAEMAASAGFAASLLDENALRRAATVFRELRVGATEPADGDDAITVRTALDGLSTADAISAAYGVWTEAAFFDEAAGLPPDRLAAAVSASARLAGAGVEGDDQARATILDYATVGLQRRASRDPDWAALRDALIDGASEA